MDESKYPRSWCAGYGVSARHPTPLTAAARRLKLSPRTLSSAKRVALGLIDVPPPASGTARHVWLCASSVDQAAAALDAAREAIRAGK